MDTTVWFWGARQGTYWLLFLLWTRRRKLETTLPATIGLCAFLREVQEKTGWASYSSSVEPGPVPGEDSGTVWISIQDKDDWLHQPRMVCNLWRGACWNYVRNSGLCRRDATGNDVAKNSAGVTILENMVSSNDSLVRPDRIRSSSLSRHLPLRCAAYGETLRFVCSLFIAQCKPILGCTGCSYIGS